MKYIAIMPFVALALLIAVSGCTYLPAGDIAVPIYNQIGGNVNCIDAGSHWKCTFAKQNSICYPDQMQIQVQQFETLAGFCPDKIDVMFEFNFNGVEYSVGADEAYCKNKMLYATPSWRQTYVISCEQGTDGSILIYKQTGIPDNPQDNTTIPNQGTTPPPSEYNTNPAIAWFQWLFFEIRSWITAILHV